MVDAQRKQPERSDEELEPQQQRSPVADKSGDDTEEDRHRQEEAEETAAAEEEEEERKDQGRALGEFESCTATSSECCSAGTYDIPHDIPQIDQQALELLFQATNGVDQYGLYASGLVRMTYLNQALAALAPKLGARKTQ